MRATEQMPSSKKDVYQELLQALLMSCPSLPCLSESSRRVATFEGVEYDAAAALEIFYLHIFQGSLQYSEIGSSSCGCGQVRVETL